MSTKPSALGAIVLVTVVAVGAAWVKRRMEMAHPLTGKHAHRRG